jgi:PAS domain S-box-containing protein
MFDLARLLSTEGFMPHGMCYLWRPAILAIHVGADSLIALAYFTIPFTLVYFVRKRAELRFTWIFLCFAMFIVACGTSHVMEIWTIWFPMYWLSGGIKVITALASVMTAILLIKLVPVALRFPSHSALQAANDELAREVLERKRAEQREIDVNASLEARVAERTQQLIAANEAQREMTTLVRVVNAELEQRVESRTAELRERESLLQEVHHRVKNNLQVISSLINMQIRGLEDESSRVALRGCQSRVITMAQIHTMLYQSADYAQVPFAKYAKDLTARILSASGTSPGNVTLEFDMEDVSLPVAQAIPCGLILNELVANALKHAFPNDSRGRICVGFRLADEHSVAKVTRDVTEQKNTERRLYETSSLLRTVLDSASATSIIATDPCLIIKVFNAGAERLLGYASDEVVGRTTPLLLHDPDEIRSRSAELSAQLERPIEGGQIFKMPQMHGRSQEWSYLRKDGGRVPVDLVVTPMQTREGELLGYVGVAQDATQQKRYEKSLRQARKDAETANGAKSLFLANMSHEIRTPMNAVIGLTYLLEQTALNGDQAGIVAQIKVASTALLSVITDVLDISKIEAGELMISNVAFSPRELLKSLHGIMRTQAELKGLTLELKMPDDLPAALQGDAARLNQILSNLLANAIKFTERGSVTLCVSLQGGSCAGSTLSFAVRDTGIGIDPAAQSRLFTPFIQADESITRRYGGTGLGLSIIRSLTTLMGGTVHCASTWGVGSEFRVVLKFAPANAESLAAAQPAPKTLGEFPLSGVRVLVVDDYDLNLIVTRRILEQAGAQVAVANNGQEAYETLEREPRACDVVLMDVQMPIMDGYEATRRIRSDLGLLNLPIIALTAGALSSERQRGTAVGMDDFIIKPFSATTLIASVLRHSLAA